MPGAPTASLSDEELALNSQGDDLASFDELVRRHETSIYRFLATKTANLTDAEDLTQQVFVRAYRKIHLYKGRYRFLPWLFTIARRESIQYYRKRKSETEFKDELVDERLPSDRLEQIDACDKLWQTIREVLPETSATAFWLRHEQELSIEEIAVVIKKTKVHVRVLLHRARLKLANHLEADQSPTDKEPSKQTVPTHV